MGLDDKVSYRNEDALNIPFSDGTFDIVWTQHAAMNIADREALYKEVARVLRPCGYREGLENPSKLPKVDRGY